ncbi:uncharacterized protein C19orf47-like isoform X2 [Corticium candelabrum]|uniref:uncharacterized protein C19orf47-like isoform X2 n=1 Tax=Corticium candelabrum TaxID=121492 RepID=UPI002E273BC2|nr:uncharacterized protein C19orf47-like isoform X2 [Corticium candelabrum]
MSSAKQWTLFFKEAGLPSGVAFEYAVIFSDNRMKDDMLGELNKELLGDMGIKKIGDVLSILRHSKAVHAEQERQKSASLLSEKVGVRTSALVSPLPSLDSEQQQIIQTQSPERSVSNGSRTTLSGFSDTWLRSDVHRLKELSSESMGMEKRRQIVPPRKAKAAVPIQEIDLRNSKRMTEAEDAGDYVVKMPRGTTAKTRRVLQMQSTQKSPGDSLWAIDRGQSSTKAVKVRNEDSAASNSVFTRLGHTSSKAQAVGQRRVEASGGRQVGVGTVSPTVPAKTQQRRVLQTRETSVFDRLGT